MSKPETWWVLEYSGLGANMRNYRVETERQNFEAMCRNGALVNFTEVISLSAYEVVVKERDKARAAAETWKNANHEAEKAIKIIDADRTKSQKARTWCLAVRGDATDPATWYWEVLGPKAKEFHDDVMVTEIFEDSTGESK